MIKRARIFYDRLRKCWRWDLRYMIDANTTCDLTGYCRTRAEARTRLAEAKGWSRA